MAGVVDTTNTFATNDVITSAAMNNIIDQTVFTSDAIFGGTLAVTSAGKLKVATSGITSNEMAANAVTTNAIADGTVTAAKLASDAVIPVGMILPRAVYGDTTGWLFCGGAAVSRTTYAALFALIGTTYGSGNASTTFNVPDLRSKFIRGELTGTTAAIGATQASNVGSHTHDVAVLFNPDNNNGNVSLSGDPSAANQSKTFTTDNGSQPGETRPINMAMPFYIKY